MKLSILLLTVPSRVDTLFPVIARGLTKQAANKPVEILALFDNKTRTVGAKRNALVSMARGEFLSFVDDDDDVDVRYVDEILAAIDREPDADVFVFPHELRVDGGPPKLCRYGIELPVKDKPDGYTGKPAHTHVWRSSIAKAHTFPELNFAEDSSWCDRMRSQVRKQARIDRVLYFYDFNSATSETRNK